MFILTDGSQANLGRMYFPALGQVTNEVLTAPQFRRERLSGPPRIIPVS